MARLPSNNAARTPRRVPGRASSRDLEEAARRSGLPGYDEEMAKWLRLQALLQVQQAQAQAAQQQPQPGVPPDVTPGFAGADPSRTAELYD